MRPEALILSSDHPRPADDALAALLRHCGVRVRRQALSEFAAAGISLKGRPAATGRLVAANVSAVAQLVEQGGGEGVERNVVHGERVLLYDMAPSAAADSALGALTRGTVTGVRAQPAGPVSYLVSSEQPSYCGTLSGMSIGPALAPHDYHLECNPTNNDLSVLVSANGKPLFAKLRVDHSEVFVLATDRLLDLDARMEEPGAAPFSQFAPIVMLARGLFGDGIWHANERFASLIVDDPLLKRNFGFLNYERLLDAMDRTGFATTIAFIPHNHRRTRRDTADLVTRRSDRFSVCFHGCDHTRAEFGGEDFVALQTTAARARRRMDALGRESGVTADDVMVFPQGVFSAVAVAALEEEGLLAAVNTSPRASNDSRPFSGAESIDVATRRYADIPVFLRRYPGDAQGLALDLFLGRPALIAAHPPDFRNGYAPISRTAEALTSAGQPLVWCGLGRIARELQLLRDAGHGRVHVIGTTDTIVLRNRSDAAVEFLVTRPEARRRVRAVQATGSVLPFRRYRGRVFFQCRLEPRSEETIRVERCLEPLAAVPAPALDHRIRVGIRRRLSEFRDEYLVRSDSLYRLAKRWAGR